MTVSRCSSFRRSPADPLLVLYCARQGFPSLADLLWEMGATAGIGQAALRFPLVVLAASLVGQAILLQPCG
jgi:hypothetical protein